MRFARRNSGFVLLLVLISIIVIGTALTVVARRTLTTTQAILAQQQAMQQRWGMFSCQRTVLPAASNIFDASDQQMHKRRGKQIAFPSSFKDQVNLGNQYFDLLLADEDAKANLNTVYDVGGSGKCEQALRSLCGVVEARSIRLIPARPSRSVLTAIDSQKARSQLSGESENEVKPVFDTDVLAFRSWGEVFDLISVNALLGDDRHLAKMTRGVSLFGTGRLNVFRATDEAITTVCDSIVQPALSKRILLKIRETSLGQMDLILQQTVTDAKSRDQLSKILGNSSQSFSIWIEATGSSTRSQRFAVQHPHSSGPIQTTEFSFE
jgi:type II secretory pathway pseudopilin PulG